MDSRQAGMTIKEEIMPKKKTGAKVSRKVDKGKKDLTAPQDSSDRHIVKMVRSEEDAQGGPLTAEVHPDEVENFKQAGWKVKEK